MVKQNIPQHRKAGQGRATEQIFNLNQYKDEHSRIPITEITTQGSCVYD